MRLAEMLADKPAVCRIPGARSKLRAGLSNTNKRLVVIDDDPTGTQTVHGTSVLMSWSLDTLRGALAGGEPVFFISTNSRSLDSQEAKRLAFELGGNLRQAAIRAGAELLIASRSDSTMRGHFPGEVEALAEGLRLSADGIIIVPAFFEGGRYTIDDIQWVEQAGEMIPAHKTEFSRDPVFGFKHSNLKEWVEEKTGGAVPAKDVLTISLELLRQGGPEAVAKILMGVRDCTYIIANAACYEDLEVLALGIQSAETQGKIFIYRCASSLVRARGGFEDKPLLTREDCRAAGGPGLVIIGSYVEKTSRQLSQLLASGRVRGIEVRVKELQNEKSKNGEIDLVSRLANEQLSAGITTVLYTSRKVDSPSSQDFLEKGSIVMSTLCEIVRHIRIKPAYLVAKGGITSIEIARAGLNVEQALVLGQIIKGVPVWRLGTEARWPDIPYVVFPGNVGDDTDLSNVVDILRGA